MCSHINALTAFPGPNGRTQMKNPYERNPLKLPDLAPNRDRELSPISKNAQIDVIDHKPGFPGACRGVGVPNRSLIQEETSNGELRASRLL